MIYYITKFKRHRYIIFFDIGILIENGISTYDPINLISIKNLTSTQVNELIQTKWTYYENFDSDYVL